MPEYLVEVRDERQPRRTWKRLGIVNAETQEEAFRIGRMMIDAEIERLEAESGVMARTSTAIREVVT